MKFWHGGARWLGAPEIRFSTGKMECGPGLYLTSDLSTAEKYARGNRVVHQIELKDGIRLAEEIPVSGEELQKFFKELKGLPAKTRAELLSHCSGYATRPAYVIYASNLLGAADAMKPAIAKQLLAWMVSKGSQASRYARNQTDTWLILHDTSVIKSQIVMNRSSADYRKNYAN